MQGSCSKKMFLGHLSSYSISIQLRKQEILMIFFWQLDQSALSFATIPLPVRFGPFNHEAD